ncbi:MAG: hypothetical protein GY940_19505 [bacterium]|nr:hypothetical protein [bacterium]
MRRKPLRFYFYMLSFIFFGALFYAGSDYYLAPLAEKVRHHLHPVLRQSGSLGHLFGIIGSLFMCLLLLYSVRKRFAFARKWGNLNTWLNVHIYLGVTGPMFVLFHTGFKFNGIVAISFWSMVLVVVSGVVGKYIYQLIPRSLSGMELDRIELEAEEIGLTFEMRKMIPAAHPIWKLLTEIENHDSKGSVISILLLVFEPLRIRRKISRLLKKSGNINGKDRKKFISIVVKRQMIIRKSKMLKYTLKILHYWHLAHKPFVIIMFLILIIHVYIAVVMGYVWIF